MTLEYLEVMEDLKRKKCVKSFKSNTRVFDDDSIEVTPQEKGEPSQKDVKKVGRSKRYATTGKNPLTCIELKCPADVEDKAALSATSSEHFSSIQVKGFLPVVA